jgi:hypothetical protein
VTPDPDTFLIALYVENDDYVISAGRPGCGQPGALSDAELACLAVARVLLGVRSEHHWLRKASHDCTRVARRLPAIAVCSWHNWSADAPVTCSLIAHGHGESR